jgi:hypothetical protein
MTQEEKRELLLKDLCARIPYDIKCKIEMWKGYDVCTIYNINSIGYVEIVEDSDTNGVNIERIKPYLFPLSSMTSEQLFEVSQIIGKDEVEIRERFLDIIDTECHVITYLEILELLEWFYKNHFDIYGLIEQGLAIDATGLNIY